MHHRTTERLGLLGATLALLLAGCGDPGQAAYAQGRYREALDRIRAAVEAAGEDASPELLVNQALVALRVGEYLEAETAAELAAARGGAGYTEVRDYLLGNAAYGRCRLARKQATTPGAPPFAFDAAIALARTALLSWGRAAMSDKGWRDSAARNAERALLELASLHKLRAKARSERARLGGGKARPHLVPGKGGGKAGRKEEVEEAPKVQGHEGGLSPGRIQGIFALLDRKEKEKREARGRRQRARSTGVEKDW